MKYTQESIIDLILNGPRSSKHNCDEFDEMLEDYMEIFTLGMNENDSDVAYGFSDWISDLYYESWYHSQSSNLDVISNAKENEMKSSSLANITTRRLKMKFSEEEDLEILKFLIEKKKFSETKDDKIWESMEKQNIILRRSGQSMKSRFNKIISPNLTIKLLCEIYIDFVV